MWNLVKEIWDGEGMERKTKQWTKQGGKIWVEMVDKSCTTFELYISEVIEYKCNWAMNMNIILTTKGLDLSPYTTTWLNLIYKT